MGMKIQSAEIWVLENIRNGFSPIVLRLTTDDGVRGLGEVALAHGGAPYAGAACAAAALLKEMTRHFVLGADPRRIEAMWNTLFRRTYWGQGGGPVIYGAISAIDTALWDIRARALGVPVYELLGGKVNDTLHVYANGWYDNWADPARFADGARKVVAAGYDALKFDPFVISGIPWGANMPGRLLTRAQINQAVARVAAVRDAVGPDVEIMIDGHGNLGVASAIEAGRALEPLRPYFFEEPTDALNVEAMRKVSRSIRIPVAAGERLYTRYQFREYIEKQVLAIVQPDLGLTGGITEMKKIASYADTYAIHFQPHRYAGPIVTAASVQVSASIPNAAMQEWVVNELPDILDIVGDALERHAKNGWLVVPEAPGIGVTLNDDLLKRYPCTRVE
jgi:galactonate dehydratase